MSKRVNMVEDANNREIFTRGRHAEVFFMASYIASHAEVAADAMELLEARRVAQNAGRPTGQIDAMLDHIHEVIFCGLNRTVGVNVLSLLAELDRPDWSLK